MSPTAAQERDVSAKEAADFLGISKRAFYGMKIPGRTGTARKWRWPMERLAAFKENARQVGIALRQRAQPRRTPGTAGILGAHIALLTIERICENKIPFPYSGPAIYFLFLREELVYIGKTVNLLARVGQHFGRKEFDHFSYIKCEASELHGLERSAIMMYWPKLNIV